jgi:hypothetical protein
MTYSERAASFPKGVGMKPFEGNGAYLRHKTLINNRVCGRQMQPRQGRHICSQWIERYPKLRQERYIPSAAPKPIHKMLQTRML